MRTTTNTDTTSEDAKRLTLIADATQGKDRRPDNTRAEAGSRGNSGKRLGFLPGGSGRRDGSSPGGRSGQGRPHLRLVPPPRPDEDGACEEPPPGREDRRRASVRRRPGVEGSSETRGSLKAVRRGSTAGRRIPGPRRPDDAPAPAQGSAGSAADGPGGRRREERVARGEGRRGSSKAGTGRGGPGTGGRFRLGLRRPRRFTKGATALPRDAAIKSRGRGAVSGARGGSEAAGRGVVLPASTGGGTSGGRGLSSAGSGVAAGSRGGARWGRPVAGGGRPRGRRSRLGAVRRRAEVAPPPVRLTRRGRAVVVVAMVLLSLGGFWLGTRAAGHAAVKATAPGHAGLPSVAVHALGEAADVLSGGKGSGGAVEEPARLGGLPGAFTIR
ncbi:hypothetical protein SAMN05421811_119182 [Nonomuraea wenchangensis]|uniref:Uncharacterized protein n=1 Tax=Nonomuraea wenchangensis TaxID=568860 RepID=A0A1I0LLY3_9ACTN|nr:hypothetical protein SAMN05421811_119182 [Nonomuraea wenchangensis]